MNIKMIYKSILLFSFTGFINSQSLQDLNKMKDEYEKFKNSNQEQIDETGLNVQSPNQFGIPNQANLLRYLDTDPLNEDTLKKSLSHFGYDFFTKRDTVRFWENLPTPKDYLLGQGDELILSLWGETQMRESYIIDREGNIFDDRIGLISMSGLDLNQGEKLLKEKFSKIFSTLKSNKPTSYINLSIGKLRSINVSFVGEVKFPGVYPIHPFSTLVIGLIQAGGVDTTGSLRRITIKRDKKNEIIFDFYEYLLSGKIDSNIQLRDQDIVVVGPRLSTVVVDSAILRPGIYEAENEESINQIIKYAGGIKPNASSQISLERILTIEQRIEGKPIKNNYYIDHDLTMSTPVQNGDKITVRFLNESTQKVELYGRGSVPIVFHFYKDMSLYDLITISGIFEDPTFISSIHLDKAEIARRDTDTRYEKIIPVNLGEIKKDIYKAKKYKLQNLDKFILNANSNYIEKDFIKIVGEVSTPGAYPLMENKENLKSLLLRAGGLTKKALPNGISIFRKKEYYNNISNEEKGPIENYDPFYSESVANQKNINNSNRYRVGWQNDEIILMPGDSIIVRQATKTINIVGEVYNPGILEFQKNKSLNYYVNAAGGITNKGDPKNIIVIYANGLVSPKKWYSSPKIEDGSTVIVNQKENQNPFNVTQFATNWTSILSSLITAVILSQQISNN